MSVQEQEEANSVFKRFETCLSSTAEHRAQVLNWALSHILLFACLNCDLYLFVQVQEEAKESRFDLAVCETRLSVHRTHRTSTQFSFSASCV